MKSKEYQAGLKFLLIDAVNKLYKGEVYYHHSLDNGIYATIVTDKTISINDIKKKMKELVKLDIPFIHKSVGKKNAINYYLKKGYQEKATNVLNISNLSVSMFEFDGMYNYFYTHTMPKSSSCLTEFDIIPINNKDIVLTYSDFKFKKKIYQSFNNYDKWLNRLNINYVSDVNKIVSDGKIRDLIRKNDIMVDTHLYSIAKDIVMKKKRIVLIAGPSSSGKTTTSKKLSLYLSSLGVNAYPISIDDYFHEREDTPFINGKMDFESLEAIDINLFNKDLHDLLDGKSKDIPIYNFILGKKEYKNKVYTLTNNDCLVIEGLHALNPNLINIEDQSIIYKIYVSPLTPLNVDRHNYISTTDNRLLRRIVRDFKTRGKSAEATLEMWKSVRAGEEKYIFPYTDLADRIHNTAYAYEMGVLKVYVEPLLYSIDMNSPYYLEARRLLDKLKTFYTIPSEYVGEDNVLREFIGNSIFEEE